MQPTSLALYLWALFASAPCAASLATQHAGSESLEERVSSQAATIAAHEASIAALQAALDETLVAIAILRGRVDTMVPHAAGARAGGSDGPLASLGARGLGGSDGGSLTTRITSSSVTSQRFAAGELNVSRALFVNGDVFFNGKRWDPEWFPTSFPTPAPSSPPTPLPTARPFPAPSAAPVPAPSKVPIPAPTPAPCTTLDIGPVGPNRQANVMSLKSYCMAAGFQANVVVGKYCWYWASNYAGPVGCVSTVDGSGYPRLSTPCSVRTWDDSGCGSGDTTLPDACARGDCSGDNPGYRIRIMCQCP